MQLPPIDVTRLARDAWKLVDETARWLRPRPEAPRAEQKRPDRRPPEVW